MVGLHCISVLLVFIGLVSGQSFVDLDPGEIGGKGLAQQRNLLQVDEGVTEGEHKEENEIKKDEKKVFSNLAGPTKFYLGDDNKPKLLMEVTGGIKIILKQGEDKETFIINQTAQGKISGSRVKLDPLDEEDEKEGVKKIDYEDLKVVIDYKGQEFNSHEEGGDKISGLLLEMTFVLKSGTFKMTELGVSHLGYKGKFHDFEFHHKSSFGYEISAPKGLSYGCYHSGVFHCKEHNASTTAGIEFPNLQLQAFKVNINKNGPVFGPIWECGNLIPIGLWVGILVSIGFASICLWGFSMLANINTMDRFDDPKRPSIHVPQTE